MKYSNILGGEAIFSKLNDLISSARASFLRLTRARLVRCTVYVTLFVNEFSHMAMSSTEEVYKYRNSTTEMAL